MCPYCDPDPEPRGSAGDQCPGCGRVKEVIAGFRGIRIEWQKPDGLSQLAQATREEDGHLD